MPSLAESAPLMRLVSVSSLWALSSSSMEEAFRLLAHARGWVLYYLPVMTVLGLSGLWEIIESWVAGAVHPELGITYLGSQGDIWDAQKDMAAAFYGALLCVMLLMIARRLRRPHAALQPQGVASESA